MNKLNNNTEGDIDKQKENILQKFKKNSENKLSNYLMLNNKYIDDKNTILTRGDNSKSSITQNPSTNLSNDDEKFLLKSNNIKSN